ncbi:MAG: diol dehydratase small subunit [Acidobacteriota bacterium]
MNSDRLKPQPRAGVEDYPLAEKHPQDLKTPSGQPFSAITLETVLKGKVPGEDLRVTREALEWQAQIAEAAGRNQLADNLRRAAELVPVPEEKILQIYEALRPGRSSRTVLVDLAAELERNFGAGRCGAFLREAAEAYFGEPAGKEPE